MERVWRGEVCGGVVSAAVCVLVGCAAVGELELASPEEATVDWSLPSVPEARSAPAEPEPEPELEPEPVLVRDEPAPGGAVAQSRPEPTEQERQVTCERAKKEARADAARNHMDLDAWGYPADCAFEFWELLAERYGVHVHHHGCVVEPEDPLVEEHRLCYSREVDVIVKERYGDDAYDKIEREADALCKKRRRRWR